MCNNFVISPHSLREAPNGHHCTQWATGATGVKSVLPAKVFQQDKAAKELFRAKIREKVDATRQRFQKRLDEETLSWLSWLPSDWVVVNDVVLEPERDEFAQIDHVLVGRPGVFLLETKAWEGTYLGVRDFWKRKEGNRWVKCPSPTQQNKRPSRLMAIWLHRELGESLPPPIQDWVMRQLISHCAVAKRAAVRPHAVPCSSWRACPVT